jgi:hypothetical protein
VRKATLREKINLTNHDLYSALAKIKAQISLLRLKSNDKNISSYLNKIEKSLARMERVLNIVYLSTDQSEAEIINLSKLLLKIASQHDSAGLKPPTRSVNVIANPKLLETVLYLLLVGEQNENIKSIEVEDQHKQVVILVIKISNEYVKDIEKVSQSYISEVAELYKGKYSIETKKGKTISRLILPKVNI